MDLAVGSSIVLYLEDDFAEPDSIPMTSVYLVAEGGTQGDMVKTGNGSRVYVTSPVKFKTGAYFDEDKKDIAIRVLVPDMCTTDTVDCQTSDGPKMGQKMTLVIESDSGIKNPPEAGTHSVSFELLGSADRIPSAGVERARNDARRKADKDAGVDPGDGEERVVKTVAKITLSDVDNSRGYEMTVTGSGFNNGTSADVYVLHIMGSDGPMASKYLWNALDCAEMNAAFGYMGDDAKPKGTSPCTMYDGLSAEHKMAVDGEKFFTSGYGEMQLCEAIVRSGTKAGGALVGSDDKVAVTFEVTAPTFGPGNTNHICMVDGEGRMSNTDVEDFKLEASIKVVPSSVASGDTVNVFAQDYPGNAGSLVELKIAGRMIPMGDIDHSGIRMDGSGTATFKMPGGFEGVLRVDAKWGSVNDDTKITIAGADLSVSKTDALPNETLTITGNGFASQSCIPAANVTLDNVAVMVDDESLGGNCDSNEIEVSNSGQFVATIILWPASGRTGGPTLIARHPRAQRRG